MAKRLSDKQKEEIIKLFTYGVSIDDLSKQFHCTKLTITRNIKKNLDEKNYKELIKKNKLNSTILDGKQNVKFLSNKQNKIKSITDKHDKKNSIEKVGEVNFQKSQFIEIAPLNFDIENSSQKDFSSVPIAEVTFPKTVFMIVDNKVELEIKYLKDFPSWSFLPEDELNRKTIEIYFDLKIAKGFCGKEKKVIKVPNTKVFRIVSPILLSRGISRIVSDDKLIAL